MHYFQGVRGSAMEQHCKKLQHFAEIQKLVAARGELDSKLDSNDSGCVGSDVVMLIQGNAVVLEHSNKDRDCLWGITVELRAD